MTFKLERSAYLSRNVSEVSSGCVSSTESSFTSTFPLSLGMVHCCCLPTTDGVITFPPNAPLYMSQLSQFWHNLLWHVTSVLWPVWINCLPCTNYALKVIPIITIPHHSLYTPPTTTIPIITIPHHSSSTRHHFLLPFVIPTLVILLPLSICFSKAP